MIARIWRGWAPPGRAGDYQRHYETEVTGHLREVSGFRGAQLLRRGVPGKVPGRPVGVRAAATTIKM